MAQRTAMIPRSTSVTSGIVAHGEFARSVDLRDKYAELLRLRRERALGQRAPNATLRRLSRRFPGSLRELEVLTDAELQARYAAAHAAPPRPAWTEWMASYHRTLGLLLTIRALLDGERSPTETRAGQVLTWLEGRGSRFDPVLGTSLVHAAAKPSRGRLSYQAAEIVAVGYGLAPGELLDTLFPPLRFRGHASKLGAGGRPRVDAQPEFTPAATVRRDGSPA